MKCIYCGKKGFPSYKNLCATCYNKLPYVIKFRAVCDDILETIKKKQEITITHQELEEQKIIFAKRVSRDVVKCITNMIYSEQIYTNNEYYDVIEKTFNDSIRKHIYEK